ncbi:MAG: helix-turn-helix domain-containing protein [Acetobacteraceae bacterium]
MTFRPSRRGCCRARATNSSRRRNRCCCSAARRRGERVASFLVGRSLETPCGSAIAHIRLPMTRGEIADYLGLTLETVSRTLSRFKVEKRISAAGSGELVLLDRPWLEELAAGLT